MKESSAGIIIYRRTREGVKFLLLYHGGEYWSFPKGKINKGEKDFQAALREVREETGLKPNNLKFKEIFRTKNEYTFIKKKEKIFKSVIYYLAEATIPIIKISREHQGYGWFSYKKTKDMLSYEELKKTLEMANETIQKNQQAL